MVLNLNIKARTIILGRLLWDNRYLGLGWGQGTPQTHARQRGGDGEGADNIKINTLAKDVHHFL